MSTAKIVFTQKRNESVRSAIMRRRVLAKKKVYCTFHQPVA